MSGARTFLAFDLGAGSGRAILGRLDSGVLAIEEIHRFANEPVRYNGELHWDAPRLWLEMRRALKIAPELDAIGVDTWGVDYALLGERGTLLENPYHYRDARTEGVMERVGQRDEIYDTTGIQLMPINTLYQLCAAYERTPRLIEQAESLVTMPDLFHFWLTGKVACEYTNATTTQLLDWRTGDWARGLMRKLGLPTHFLAPMIAPGTPLGQFGTAMVVAPACHDTGSAVAAVNASGRTAFLSSGTWSLLGTEIPAPIVTLEARRLNFTNEGGVGGTIRLLKNITGLWLLEGCRGEWSYEQLLAAAAEAAPLEHLIDPDSPAFVRPASMTEAIARYCERTEQAAPASPGAYTRAIFESLALKYRLVLGQLESITGVRYEAIRVIGGGSQNAMLNQFTADATGCRVLAGPAEATALGNLMMQMVGTGAVASIEEGREMIARSFPERVFEPRPSSAWKHAYRRFEAYCRIAVD